MIDSLFQEFKSSIKSPDTEEKLDLIFYRPSGFIIAKISSYLWLTPTMLSLFGLGCGVISAWYFLKADNTTALILASCFLILSGIFDSADGQLARISNQSTKLGLILDGICDSFVTIFTYIACAAPYYSKYGVVTVLVVLLALYLHSCQCAILDFYHREYLFYGYGKTENDTYWNPGLKDAQEIVDNSKPGVEKIMNSLRMSWIKKQQFLTTRPDSYRQKMRHYILNCSSSEKEKFMATYKKNNLRLLPFWRLIGVNAHTFLLIVFMFLNRFDLYILGFDIVLLNVIIFLVGLMQKKADNALFQELSISFNE